MDFTLYILIPRTYPFPGFCALPLQRPPKQNLKVNIKQNNNNKDFLKNGMEAVLWSSESHSIPFSPYNFTWNNSLQWVIALV